MLPSTIQNDLRGAIAFPVKLQRGSHMRGIGGTTDWRSLVHQAYQVDPLQTKLSSNLWQGNFKIPTTEVLLRETDVIVNPLAFLQPRPSTQTLPWPSPNRCLTRASSRVVECSSRFESPALGQEGVLCMGFLRAH